MTDEKQANQVQGTGITGGTAVRDRPRQGAASVQASASEAMRQEAETAAEAGRVGAKALHLTHDLVGDVARCAATAGLESGRQLLEATAKQVEEFSRQMAETIQTTTEEMRSLVALPTANGGLRDMQQAVAGLVDGVTRANLRITQEVFRLASPGAVIELQQRMAREYFDALAGSQTAILRAAHRTAEDTLRPLETWTRALRHGGGQEQASGTGAAAR
ncbi:hypothetical protein JMJ55_29365 [Belnapia sp. T6]|uniref:Phasin domain-containing protein n=1 Tax=Belnapia mucosa TaxID=2804532 RepID=A0ABS1VDQ5_9PROT|nr:hypothetical protein [Belnapia mucosa]MBL6459427.1 hypothetical protein [Belnapia mucosa]